MLRCAARCVVTAALALTPAGASARPHEVASGRVSLPLYRPWRGAPKVYVEAMLPDGSRGLFLVDTGADVSVIGRDLAARLSLPLTPDAGVVHGLDAEASVDLGRLPWIQLGGLTVPDVGVAVGVEGHTGRHGALPVEGILGSNVWSRFVVELDLRADRLVLARAGARLVRGRSTELVFDGRHPYAPVQLAPLEDPTRHAAVLLLVDTGATGILLRGDLDPALEGLGTEGVERVHGVARGLGDPAAALRLTRRIALASVGVGGRRLGRGLEARWLGDGRGLRTADGLLGQAAVDGRRLLLDVPGRRIAVRPSLRLPAHHDGKARWLALDREAWGRDPGRAVARAPVLAALGATDEALALLDERIAEEPTDAEAHVVRAGLLRASGALDEADELLTALPAASVLARGALPLATHALLAAGREAAVEGLLAALPADHPEVLGARVALAAARGDVDHGAAALEALRALGTPAPSLAVPDALIALAAGDTERALTVLRAAVLADPTDGTVLRAYASVATDADLGTLRADLARVIELTHPALRDAGALAWTALRVGDPLGAERLRAEGVARTCAGLRGAPHDNCRAWLAACAGTDLERALTWARRAVTRGGATAARLDTLATVLLRLDRLEEALDAARLAVRRDPVDPALRWTLAWIHHLRAAPAAPPEPR